MFPKWKVSQFSIENWHHFSSARDNFVQPMWSYTSLTHHCRSYSAVSKFVDDLTEPGYESLATKEDCHYDSLAGNPPYEDVGSGEIPLEETGDYINSATESTYYVNSGF